ncbi:MAG: hypothetical protein HYY23_04605 [Verrucomicrobia bacterium]|nr:hypothetical protein [Verrucomicrobiota bacterium]
MNITSMYSLLAPGVHKSNVEMIEFGEVADPKIMRCEKVRVFCHSSQIMTLGAGIWIEK